MNTTRCTLLALALGMALGATPAFATVKAPTTQSTDAVSARTTERESGRKEAPVVVETTVAANTAPVEPLAVLTRSLWLQLDSNGDARLSAGEVVGNAKLSAAFPAMDGNGDGFVTQAEYRAYATSRR